MTRGETASGWQYGVATAGTMGVLALVAFAVASDQPTLQLVTIASIPLALFVLVAAFGVRLADRESAGHVRFVTAAGVATTLGYLTLVTWFYALVDHSHTLLGSAQSFYLTYGTASLGLAFGVVTAHHYRRQRDKSRELGAANEELRAQNERLDEFASILSHDLRNPLQVASGYVELAEETGDLDHLEDVHACHDRIEALVEQVLALARMERDPDAVRTVDVAGVATDALETVDAADCDVVVDVDCTVRVERSDLQQVFENVYRNSIEHAGPDPTVRVSCLDDTGFAIEDDGPGIPPGERDRVLERGYSNADGTGLGLAIVAEVADVYDWDLAITEGVDGGARFEFHTPTVDAESTATASEDDVDDGREDAAVERPAPR